MCVGVCVLEREGGKEGERERERERERKRVRGVRSEVRGTFCQMILIGSCRAIQRRRKRRKPDSVKRATGTKKAVSRNKIKRLHSAPPEAAVIASAGNTNTTC